MNKEKFTVSGMTCTSCQANIENKLNKTKGINSATINFVKKELNVTYDEKEINSEKIKKIIKDIGYKLDSNEEQKKDNRLLITFIPMLLVLYFALTHMFKEVNMPSIWIIDHHENTINFAIFQLVLTTFIMIVSKDIFIKGFKNLIKKAATMESLIAIGTTSAYIYSIVMTYLIIDGNTKMVENLYFETTAVILFFIILGKHLEQRSINKTNDAVKKLMDLSPETAIVLIDNKEVEVSTNDLKPGDICIIKPGSKIPTDAIVVEGTSYIDESLITGEPIAVLKEINSEVIGASINQKGYLKIKITKSIDESLLANIIKLIEEASSKKAPIAKIADVTSLYFVPIVLVIAIVSALVWFYINQDIMFSLTIFISVLVIACPCALGLATPVSIIIGIAKGAEAGVLIKSGEALETLSKAKTIIFDKTGTLTIGKPEVILINSDNEKLLLEYAASLEKKSEHPLGTSIVKYAEEKGIELKEVQDFEVSVGLGIKGIINNKLIKVGNNKFVGSTNESDHSKQGKTVVYVSEDENIIGEIIISDKIKDNAKELIKDLEKEGLTVYMITGDNINTANAVANELGIKNVIAEVLPEEKYNYVKKLQQENNVIMVGDGINDSIALKEASIGIAIGSGTDIAIAAADVILISNDLNAVKTAIKLSKMTINNIKQNLFWAFLYNILGIPIAAGVLYSFTGMLLNPMIAGIAMSFSSVSVLMSALSLRKKKIR